MTLLEELLGECKISDFAKEWISRCNTDDETIKQTYTLLRSYGLEDRHIASNGHLLGLQPERVARTYQILSDLGMAKEKIASDGRLLGNSPKKLCSKITTLRNFGINGSSIAKNPHLLKLKKAKLGDRYFDLLESGFTHDEITNYPHLLLIPSKKFAARYIRLVGIGLTRKKIMKKSSALTSDDETFEKKHNTLISLGLSDEHIARSPELLTLNVDTIKNHYTHHYKALARIYGKSAKDMLMKQPGLIGISPNTIDANIDYLNYLQVDFRGNPALLASKPQTKRKKLAWVLREIFGYMSYPKEQKREVVRRLFRLARERPYLLVKSIAALEKMKPSLERAIFGSAA